VALLEEKVSIDLKDPSVQDSETLGKILGGIESFLHINVFKGVDFFSGVDSNLSVWEIEKLSRSIRGGLSSDVTDINIGENTYTKDALSDVGEVVRQIDVFNLDSAFEENSDIVKSKELLREQARVEIYNASGIAGAASRYARIVENSGCTVVRFGNAPDYREKTEIFVSDPQRYAHSLQVIRDVFFIEPTIIYERPTFMTTGDIIILIGEDLKGELQWGAE